MHNKKRIITLGAIIILQLFASKAYLDKYGGSLNISAYPIIEGDPDKDPDKPGTGAIRTKLFVKPKPKETNVLQNAKEEALIAYYQ